MFGILGLSLMEACLYVCVCSVYVMGPVITAYVCLMLVAVGSSVVRLLQGGMCVYHVWLCSSS